MVCRDFILPEPASYVFFYAVFNLRNLLYIIWLFDVMNCVNSIPREIFTLDEMYRHGPQLQEKHPMNHNIRPKIRQQLQFLRDEGFIEFLGNGKYKKLV